MALRAGACRRYQQVAQAVWPHVHPAVTGQPTWLTHPELLAEGELAPGLSGAEFSDRRARLARLLPPGGVAVVPGSAKTYRTGAIPYPYRQDADFLYLTGITQQAVAVISAPSTPGEARYTLFVPKGSLERERWDGASLNCEAAVGVFGADEAYPVSELETRLGALLAGSTCVVYDSDADRSSPAWQAAALRAALQLALGQLPEERVQPLRHYLHPLRWVKSAAELALLRKSAAISAAAMARCLRLTREGVSESVLAATFEYECRVRGAQHMAYPQVVGSGLDACTIHYSRNDKMAQDGDLLLMDAGNEYYGYCSDVTRTWPVSGAFSPQQRDVYEVVRDTHRQCVAACQPGATLRQIHQLSVRLLCDGLAQLRVFPGLSPDTLAGGAYQTVYPHSVGHWLGLDTHDTAAVGYDRPLRPGVTLTVEPGLYLPPDSIRFGRFAGIGVRIEDDVVVSQAGPEVLSASVPADAEEVERLVGAAIL
ncbi:hypothetical protein WJX81_007251 [Elliptochloris bilobata]|uniref:Aminopeptidase P N-terminal domain-containing protein n=1 Tax=Elliptochloris bilobata TaxID=381761 RepID=A0AAW1QMH8_9CHLO